MDVSQLRWWKAIKWLCLFKTVQKADKKCLAISSGASVHELSTHNPSLLFLIHREKRFHKEFFRPSLEMCLSEVGLIEISLKRLNVLMSNSWGSYIPIRPKFLFQLNVQIFSPLLCDIRKTTLFKHQHALFS